MNSVETKVELRRRLVAERKAAETGGWKEKRNAAADKAAAEAKGAVYARELKQRDRELKSVAEEEAKRVTAELKRESSAKKLEAQVAAQDILAAVMEAKEVDKYGIVHREVSKGLDRVVEILHKHEANADICGKGLGALMEISLHLKKYHAHPSFIIGAGALGPVVSALSKHGENVEICAVACKIMMRLALVDSKSCPYILAAGALGPIVAALTRHEANVDVCEDATLILNMIVLKTIDYKYIRVKKTEPFGPFGTSISFISVKTKIVPCPIAAMKEAFVVAGAINAIINAFVAHPEIVFNVCTALRFLAGGNSKICEAVVVSGAIGPTVSSLCMCTGLTAEIDLHNKQAASSLLETLGFNQDGSPKSMTCPSGHLLQPTRHQFECPCSLCGFWPNEEVSEIMMRCLGCNYGACVHCNIGPKTFAGVM